MYEMFNTTPQQSQANSKAIANMVRQIAQMAEDQRKRDNGKLPITTEVNPTHAQRAGKEHVNVVEAEWRKVTLDDLLESGSEAESEKEEIKTEEEQVEKEPQPQEDKEVHKEDQPMVAGIKQRKKDKKGKKKSNKEDKTPTPEMVRLTVVASEALLGTLPKKERDPGSPLITITVGDVIIRNTLLDLGASVNVLPGYLYDKYKNEELEPARTVLQLANQSTKVSRGEGAKEEILGEARQHPLSTIDKVQLLDMMELMEMKHQRYEKDARCREAKVFQLLDAQQQ
ncbi:hypothetical protein L1887_28116 [Cichorium endivia]|nr:hypothetical protein L1887_28116 [Cichorium endivia]